MKGEWAMRHLFILGIAVCLVIISADFVNATPFTPLQWQRRVLKSFDPHFVDQRKHTTWVRDRNRNFIDDIIDKRMKREESKEALFNIIVDLNAFLSIKEINKIFDNKGHVTYVGKMITFVYVDHVRGSDLGKIARMDTVAMVEIQPDLQPVLDTSARAVQAKACQHCLYAQQSAAEAGYTGSGINIAIIDTGVDDFHEQFAGKFRAGFDATAFDDQDHDGVDDSGNEPADGTTNPDDDWNFASSAGHGTHVAGIALGKGVGERNCRKPESEYGYCGGIAPEAGLVDIRVCKAGSQESQNLAEALDWLGLNFSRSNINVRVSNISLAFSIGSDDRGNPIYDDDGTSALAQQVNYLSALGIVMVTAHGNSVPNFQDGDRVTHSPGSASFAVTVSGTNDHETVERSDDTIYRRYLVGPRCDFEQTGDILALKPDLSAPAENIWSAEFDTTTSYHKLSGTSLAAPHVSGAAALMLQASAQMNRGAMPPGSVKHALVRSADNMQNQMAFPNTHPDWEWDKAFGWGLLNVRAAVDLITDPNADADVGFPTCSGAPGHAAGPCTLSFGLPPWNNNRDLSTSAPPQAGVENEIQAIVRNAGPNAVKVLVNFGVYHFGVGNNAFFHIGTKEAEIAPESTQLITQPWKPESAGHQCIQVSIDYGADTNFHNNVTQRNLQVSASEFTVRVENPFSVPAEFHVRPASQREGWQCSVANPKFTLHPFLDPPENVQIHFDAPDDALPGQRAECDIAVLARPKGAATFNSIGGVTIQTFVPKPCRIIGWLRDEEGRPLEGAKMILRSIRQSIEAESDKYGFVSFEGAPYVEQKISVHSYKYGNQSSKEPVRLYCGAGTFEIVVTGKGLIVETNRRTKDWAFDSQLKEGYDLRRK